MKENKNSDTNEERNITSTTTTATNDCVLEAEQDSAHPNSAAAQLMVNPINGFSGLSSPLLESIESIRKDYQALFTFYCKRKSPIHSEQAFIDERDYLAGVAAPASLLTHRVRGCNEIYHLK